MVRITTSFVGLGRPRLVSYLVSNVSKRDRGYLLEFPTLISRLTGHEMKKKPATSLDDSRMIPKKNRQITTQKAYNNLNSIGKYGRHDYCDKCVLQQQQTFVIT